MEHEIATRLQLMQDIETTHRSLFEQLRATRPQATTVEERQHIEELRLRNKKTMETSMGLRG